MADPNTSELTAQMPLTEVSPSQPSQSPAEHSRHRWDNPDSTPRPDIDTPNPSIVPIHTPDGIDTQSSPAPADAIDKKDNPPNGTPSRRSFLGVLAGAFGLAATGGALTLASQVQVGQTNKNRLIQNTEDVKLAKTQEQENSPEAAFFRVLFPDGYYNDQQRRIMTDAVHSQLEKSMQDPAYRARVEQYKTQAGPLRDWGKKRGMTDIDMNLYFGISGEILSDEAKKEARDYIQNSPPDKDMLKSMPLDSTITEDTILGLVRYKMMLWNFSDKSMALLGYKYGAPLLEDLETEYALQDLNMAADKIDELKKKAGVISSYNINQATQASLPKIQQSQALQSAKLKQHHSDVNFNKIRDDMTGLFVSVAAFALSQIRS